METGSTPAMEAELGCSHANAGQTGSAPSPADLGWAINVVSRTFRQWASASLTDLPGGPRGYLVLSTVTQDLPRSQLALAQQLGVDRTAMTYLLDALEAASLVERRPDPADRRQRQVVATPKGRAVLEEVSGRLAQLEQRLLSALTPDEADVFRQLFGRVARSTQEAAGPCLSEAAGDPGDGPCPGLGAPA